MDANENGGSTKSDNSVYLFIVSSQTFSADEAKSNLNQISSGLNQFDSSLDSHKTELLNALQHQSLSGSVSIDQEYRIGYKSDSGLQFELQVNSKLSTFKNGLRKFLLAENKQKYLILTSFDYNSLGDVHLQDGLFGYDDFNHILNDEEIKKSTVDSSIKLFLSPRLCENNRNWKLLEKLTQFNISLNYTYKKEQQAAAATVEQPTRFVQDFSNFLKPYFNEKPSRDFIESFNQRGTLRIEKPVFYIFPAKEGDAACFAINGFTMLINGGYDRVRPCFWKFLNVLSQLDSILITHNDSDACGGLSTFFSKKLQDNKLRPNVLNVLGNLISETSNKQQSTAAANAIASEIVATTNNEQLSDSELILDAINKLNIKLMPLIKNNVPSSLSSASLLSTNKYEHINLYYKLGQGSLDLYVLSPFATSAEYKEFVQQQQNHLAKNLKQHKSQLEVNSLVRNVPLSHLNSAVVLLVWLPFNSHNSHTGHKNAPSNNSSEHCALRFLFTGNAPQSVVFHALEKVKEFDVLSTPVYKSKSIETGVPQSVANANPNKKPAQGQSEASTAATDNKKDTLVKDSSNKNPTRASLQLNPASKQENKEKQVKEKEEKSNGGATNGAAASSKPPVVPPVKKQPPPPVESKKRVEKTAPAANGNGTVDNKEKDSKKTAPHPAKPVQKNPSTGSGEASKANGNSEKTSLTKPPPKSAANESSKSAATNEKANAPTLPVSKPKPAANKTEKGSPSTTSQSKETVFAKKSKPLDDNNKGGQAAPPAKKESESRIITKRNAKPGVATAAATASVVVTEPAASVVVTEPVVSSIVASDQVNVEVKQDESTPEETRNCENIVKSADSQKQQDLVEISSDIVEAKEIVEQTTTTTTNILVEELVERREIVEESMTKNQSFPDPSVNFDQTETSNSNSNPQDIMTRSFIEDPTNPQSNPFISSSDHVTVSAATLDDSNQDDCDQNNRYAQNGFDVDHENGFEHNHNGYHQNGHHNGHQNGHSDENGHDSNGHSNENGDHIEQVTDDLVEQPKYFNESKQILKSSNHALDSLVGDLDNLNIREGSQPPLQDSNKPENWNLLELPTPVNPDLLNTSQSEKKNLENGNNGAISNNNKRPSTTSSLKPDQLNSSPLADSSNKLKKMASSTTNNANEKHQAPKQVKVQHPAYLEVCYIPAHGNGHYSDLEFFRRVRSRHYILSTQEPNQDLLNALVKAKESWEEKQLQVSIIPTYESDVLRSWFIQNEEKLAKLKIDVHPAANLATLSMDDLPDFSCQVYKLEF